MRNDRKTCHTCHTLSILRFLGLTLEVFVVSGVRRSCQAVKLNVNKIRYIYKYMYIYKYAYKEQYHNIGCDREGKRDCQ